MDDFPGNPARLVRVLQIGGALVPRLARRPGPAGVRLRCRGFRGRAAGRRGPRCDGRVGGRRLGDGHRGRSGRHRAPRHAAAPRRRDGDRRRVQGEGHPRDVPDLLRRPVSQGPGRGGEARLGLPVQRAGVRVGVQLDVLQAGRSQDPRRAVRRLSARSARRSLQRRDDRRARRRSAGHALPRLRVRLSLTSFTLARADRRS